MVIITNTRWHRPSSAAARQMRRSQKKAVRRDHDIYVDRRASPPKEKDNTVHIKTYGLYQSAGWGSSGTGEGGRARVLIRGIIRGIIRGREGGRARVREERGRGGLYPRGLLLSMKIGGLDWLRASP